MSDIDIQIAAIKQRRDKAHLAKIRAEATKENAQATEDAAKVRLKEEFGVDNVEDARAKLGELQAEVDKCLSEITNMLDQIEL